MGRFDRPVASGASIVALDLLRQEARQATGLRPILAMDLASFSDTWFQMSPSALASAVVAQEGLEGGGRQNIRAVYLNTLGVDFNRGGSLANSRSKGHTFQSGAHTAAEYRNIVATMAAGAHKVDIYIEHKGGISIIRTGSMTTEGARLPEFLANSLPTSFFEHGRRPSGGGGKGGGGKGGGGKGGGGRGGGGKGGSEGSRRSSPGARSSSAGSGLGQAPKGTASALKGPAKPPPGAVTVKTMAGGGRAAAVAMLIVQAAEIFGLMKRDKVFERYFMERQNDYFKRLGVSGTEYIFADGTTTRVYVPSSDQLSYILARDIGTWKEYRRFESEAYKYGFDFQFLEWVYVLNKNDEGEDVLLSWDGAIRDLHAKLRATDGPPPRYVFTDRAGMDIDMLDSSVKFGGVQSILEGEWRGFFEEGGNAYPLRVELDDDFEGDYSYQDASGRKEGELSDPDVSEKAVIFNWQEGSSSGRVRLSFENGKLKGGWSFKGARLNAGKWEMARKSPGKQ